MDHRKTRNAEQAGNAGQAGYSFLLILLFLLFAQWLPLSGCSHQTPDLTPEEWAWLKDNKSEIRLHFDCFFPPLEYADHKDGSFSGMSADIVSLIEKRLNIQIRKSGASDWNSALRDIKSGRCHLLPAIVRTPEREEYIYLTKPYITIPLGIIGRSTSARNLTLESLHNVKIALVSGYATESYVRSKAAKDIEIIPVQTVQDGVRLTSFGKVDYFIDNLAVASYYVHSNKLSNLQVCGDLDYTFPLSIGISRHYPILYSIMEKSLQSISASELEKLENHWITRFTGEQSTSASPAFLATVLLIALAMLALLLLLRRRLKATSLKLRHADTQLDMVKRQIPDTMVYRIIMNPETGERQFVSVSRSIMKLHGYTEEQVLKNPTLLYTQIHPDDQPRLAEAEKSAVENSSFFQAEVRFILPMGQERWSIISSSPTALPDGRIQWDGIETDITRHKVLAKALEESERRYRMILETAPIGIFHRNLNGEYDYANQSLLDSFKCSSLEEFRANYGRIKDRWASPEQHDQFMSLLLSQGKVSGFDVQVNLVSGEIRWFSLYVYYEEDTESVNGFALDITQRREAAAKEARLSEQLHQSQKMEAIGQLAGGVAHDFNNALGGILGALELIMTEDNLSAEQQEFCELIMKAGERAGDLTKKLLAFSRHGAKASTAIDCFQIVTDTVALLSHTIDRSITLELKNQARHTNVIGDNSMLQNALMNVGINASHAMPEGGTLTYSLSNIVLDQDYCGASTFDISPGEYLEIAIRDTGTGMSREVLDHIFEPFFTTKGEGKGTGLGLAAVYGTIQEHGGAITVYSEPGQGTVFRIYLPASAETAERDLRPESIPMGSGTVLIVDDEDLIRTTARAMLKTMGYKVHQATNGLEGIETFTLHRDEIDAIILDMIMPVMGGREAFTRLREIDPGIPIIISSGFSKEEDLQELQKRGVSGFLNKPFRRAELAESLHRVLAEKKI